MILENQKKHIRKKRYMQSLSDVSVSTKLGPYSCEWTLNTN